MPVETPPWGPSRSRIMTSSETTWPSTKRQLALRRFSLTLMGLETPPWVPAGSVLTLSAAATWPWVVARSCLMTFSQTASHLASSTMLSALLRSLITLTDSATTLLATPRFSIILSPLQTPPLVMSRSRLMTRTHSASPTTTWQLALRRCSITLMAVKTQSWVQGQDKTWSLASITLTSATSLVPSTQSETHFRTKAIRSASATYRTGTGPGP